jgi:hypothetical protein
MDVCSIAGTAAFLSDFVFVVVHCHVVAPFPIGRRMTRVNCRRRPGHSRDPPPRCKGNSLFTYFIAFAPFTSSLTFHVIPAYLVIVVPSHTIPLRLPPRPLPTSGEIDEATIRTITGRNVGPQLRRTELKYRSFSTRDGG